MPDNFYRVIGAIREFLSWPHSGPWQAIVRTSDVPPHLATEAKVTPFETTMGVFLDRIYGGREAFG
jgi:hypothetical protein